MQSCAGGAPRPARRAAVAQPRFARPTRRHLLSPPPPQYRTGSAGDTPCVWEPKNLPPHMCTHVNYAFVYLREGEQWGAVLGGAVPAAAAADR